MADNVIELKIEILFWRKEKKSQKEEEKKIEKKEKKLREKISHRYWTCVWNFPFLISTRKKKSKMRRNCLYMCTHTKL